MHAATTASLRNQLLSNDVGNIDVRHETPINGQRVYQPHPQQQRSPHPHLQQPQQMRYAGSPHPAPPPQQQQQFYPVPPPQQHFQPPPPQSRRSSMTSTHSGFNNMFNKFGKKKSGGGGGGDEDDDDDDGKDVMVDPTAVTMSFDDLSSIRDRGRYGMSQQTFDTAPIIPTLHTPASRPGSNGPVSNTQYRKQMTAMKKQVLNQAGKVRPGPPDPRAMSLQSMGNPYNAGPGSKANSFTSQSNPYVAGGPIPPGGPRANSLTQFPQQGPRAYSLTTNPYQQQKRMMSPGPPQRGPMPAQSPYMRPVQQRPPPQGYAPNPALHQQRLSQPSVSSPLSGNTQGYPSPNPQRTSLGSQPPQMAPLKQPVPQQAYHQQQPAPQPQQQQQQQQPQQQQQQPQVKSLSHESIPEESESPFVSTLDPGSTSKEKSMNHHFLADNTINADDTATTNNTHSSINETLPNGQSTPSPLPERAQTALDSNGDPISPSKLPRIKALPRLSVLSIRDDEDEDEQTPMKPRVLEPVREGAVEQSYPRVKSPANGESYFQSPDKSPRRPMSSRISPHKHNKNAVSISSMSEYSAVSDSQTDLNENAKKLYQLSQASGTNNDVFVTASQFSLMDSQLGQQQQQQQHKRESVASTVSVSTDPDATPKLYRRSMDEHSLKSNRSTSSLKGFFKNMSLKKKKPSMDDSNTTIKQVPMKSSTPLMQPAPLKEPKEPEELTTDSTNESSIESKPTTLAESFVPQQQKQPKLGFTVDQLGIMEEKTSIIRELDLVSRELAASIQREIALEKQLVTGSPVKEEHLSQPLELAELVQQLNEERKKRYIAEEHVLMLENGSKPSALELSYELNKLKSELAQRDELIHKQSSEIDALKKETPDLKKRVEDATEKNKVLVNDVIPQLKNEIEILKAENKNVAILKEKLKILKNEKEQLENFSFTGNNTDNDIAPPKRPERSPGMLSPSKRLASFNLISVSPSE